MIVTLAETESYCRVDNLNIYIPETKNTLNFKYDAGATTSITLTTNRYLPATLAAAIQALMRTEFSDTKITVTWSSTINKFTIATTTVGVTLQYINADSTSGIYIGFTEDSSAALSIVGDSVIIDDTTLLDDFRSRVDAFVKTYTKRAIEAADYSGLYGFNNGVVALPDFPINSITTFTTNIADGIGMVNSSYYITLKYDGTTFTFSDGNTILKSAVTLISDLVTAINAVDNGTTATANTEYAALSVDRILEFNPKTVNTYQIKIYSYNIVDYDTVESLGLIYPSVESGTAYISYNAGYATVPEDLKQATLMIIKSMYDRWLENAEDQNRYRLNDIYKFYDEIPDKAKMTLDAYKRIIC